jgi:hypothetical protein
VLNVIFCTVHLRVILINVVLLNVVVSLDLTAKIRLGKKLIKDEFSPLGIKLKKWVVTQTFVGARLRPSHH